MTPSHPLFTAGAENDWFDFSIIDDACGDEELIALIKRDRDRIVEAAVSVLRHFLKLSIPADHSGIVTEHLVSFRSNADRSFYSYLEFRLETEPWSNDSWWVIVACPHPFHEALAGHRYNVWRFGWECQ